MSRIIKLIVAIAIAIALTAGFLYVKLKKDERNNIETKNQIITRDAEKFSDDVKVLEELSVPQSEQKTEEAKVNEQKTLESLSVKQEKSRNERADLDLLKSLSK